MTNSNKLAVVLVRGLVKIRKPVKDTLTMLRITRKNHAVVIENNPVNKGMLHLVKDYVTWGEISAETVKELVAKRGEKFQSRESDSKKRYNYNFLEFEGKKYKHYFRLNPPRKGFGRKGIKLSFTVGGALGHRGDKINDLIKRML
ncbi:MAG TPA: uL30 family ribosomal protein [Candidatus Nanoarchaeia archaeon]|nr:uL30 family ribosomal protein [Candidatus Nanoarchaeia archaeon]